MQTIEIAIDEALLAQIDRVTRELSLTRAAFIQMEGVVFFECLTGARHFSRAMDPRAVRGALSPR